MAEPIYECPKCEGRDIYFRKQRELKGIGGIYGNRQKLVRAPFCKVCGIEAEQMFAHKEVDAPAPSGTPLSQFRRRSPVSENPLKTEK